MLTTMGFKTAREAKVHQRIQAGICHSKDMATAATVAAIRTTKLLVLFMPKRCATVSAVSRSDLDRGFIHKFHDMYSKEGADRRKKQKARTSGPFALETSLMVHPRRLSCPAASMEPVQTGVMLTI